MTIKKNIVTTTAHSVEFGGPLATAIALHLQGSGVFLELFAPMALVAAPIVLAIVRGQTMSCGLFGGLKDSSRSAGGGGDPVEIANISAAGSNVTD